VGSCDGIKARYKAAAAAYLAKHSEELKSMLDATNPASMERTASEGVAPIDAEWIQEAFREASQPNG
jgi:hypothetical protein